MRHFGKLIQYEAWANRLIAEALAEAGERGRPLHLLAHLLAIQTLWLDLITGRPLSTGLWPERTPADCVALIDTNEQAWLAYLETASADELERLVTYPPADGGAWRQLSMRDAISGIVIHSSYHRGQIILHLKGKIDALPLTTYPSFASQPL